MKVSEDEAHVCLGRGEVEEGDKVALFRNDCSRGKSPGFGKGTTAFRSCEKIKIGEGTVTKVLNEHYSVVKISPGVRFEEGTIVEKL